MHHGAGCVSGSSSHIFLKAVLAGVPILRLVGAFRRSSHLLEAYVQIQTLSVCFAEIVSWTFYFSLHLHTQNTRDSYFHCHPSRGLNLLISISGNIPPSVYLDSKIKIRAEFKHRDTQGLRFAAENTR